VTSSQAANNIKRLIGNHTDVLAGLGGDLPRVVFFGDDHVADLVKVITDLPRSAVSARAWLLWQYRH
jgi:hypothetical protein